MHDFETIYRENAELVYRFLFSISHDADLAEELTQQTFYEAIRAAGGYRGEAAFSTYLCGIAKNLLKKEFSRRAKHAHEPIVQAEQISGPQNTEEEALAAAERAALFLRIQTLPEKMCEVFYLRAAGDLPFAKIAELLGQSETWARVTFYRAKQKIKEGEADEC